MTTPDDDLDQSRAISPSRVTVHRDQDGTTTTDDDRHDVEQSPSGYAVARCDDQDNQI